MNEIKDRSSFVTYIIFSVINTFLEIFSLFIITNLLFVIADLDKNTSKYLLFINEYIKDNPILLSTYLMLITIVFKFLFQTIYSFKQERFGYTIQKKISQKVFSKILNVDYLDYQNLSSSKVTRILNSDLIRINNQLISPLISVLNETLLILSIALVIFFYNPYLGISMFIFSIIVVSLFILTINKKVKFYSKEGIRLSTSLIKHILESHKAFIAINFFNVKFNFKNKFDNISSVFTEYGYKTIFLLRLPKNIFELLIFLSLSLLILVLYTLNKNDLIIEYVGILSLATFKIIPSLNKLSVSIQAIQYFSPPFYEILRLLKLKEISAIDTKKPNNFKTIEYQDLSFSYGKNEVLKNSNFLINKNDFIGIIGDSGSGKSTLINVLSGLLKTNNLKIKLDNELLKSPGLKNLFSIVQQETVILDQNIYENIALNFKVKTSDKKHINDLLEKVNLFSVFKEKLEEDLGENGNKISGGQKQRIGIARALFFNKKILILDESISNLDQSNQSEIIELLNELSNLITIIFISHNHQNLKYCNRVIEVKNGGLIEVK